METIVEVYRHVGVKVRTDLGKRNIPGSRMATLTARFDAIDAATNAVDEVGIEVGWYYMMIIRQVLTNWTIFDSSLMPNSIKHVSSSSYCSAWGVATGLNSAINGGYFIIG